MVVVASLYFNLISVPFPSPPPGHRRVTWPVRVSHRDFLQKMMAINLDLLLPSAPKKCLTSSWKGNEGWRRSKKEMGDVCFMEIMKWWLNMTPEPLRLDGGEIWFIFHIQTELWHFYTVCFFSKHIETINPMISIICNSWGVEQTLCFGLVK